MLDNHPRLRRVLFGEQPEKPKPASPHPIWDELTTKHGTPQQIWAAA